MFAARYAFRRSAIARWLSHPAGTTILESNNRSAALIDLHTHSTCSDGALDPAALVAVAAERGVTTLALTDHDTVAGLDAAHAACRAHGMALVAGVEISVTWQRRTLHIVGLAFDPYSPALATGLAGLQASRRIRAERIAAKLEKLGVADALARASALAGDGQIGRPHFARLLIDSGRCKDMQQAFKRFLKPGKPGYAAIEWASIEQAIAWIQAAGGLAVLAHPLSYDQSGAWRRRMLAAFAQAGGDAVEVCTGVTDAQQVAVSKADAHDHRLLASVGSDFHSPDQRWLALGGTRPLPASLPPVWRDPRFRAMA